MKRYLVKWLRKLLPFKCFHNDWLDVSGMMMRTGRHHKLNLDYSFFDNIRFDDVSLKQYRIDAAKLCAESLGNKPALCFSGGVDSQAMIMAWREANLNADIFILRFDNDLNSQDYNHAIEFCKKIGIDYNVINIDITNFLSRENYNIGIKYKSASPHFNVHYKLVEILRDRGYTGVCFGGQAPNKNFNTWGKNFEKNPLNFVRIQDVFEIPVQGSFLSYYPQLAWAITLLTESFDEDQKPENTRTEKDFTRLINIRYPLKVLGYQRAGFPVIPQETKFTGFELVKKYFENLTGDGWTFEKRFRFPLAKLFDTDFKSYQIEVDEVISNKLESIYLNNFGSDFRSSTGISV